MPDISRRTLLWSGVSFSSFPGADREPHYLFSTADFDIQMTLEYHDCCTDRELKFLERSSGRRYCLSFAGEQDRNCVSSFKGSITVAHYKISSRIRSAASPILREYVISIDRSDRVAMRPPYEGAIEIQHGLASDIQVFGYRDSSQPQSTRPQGPDDDAWCLFRQNLYLSASAGPFLVVHWKHTLDRIRILDLIPANGTLLLTHDLKHRR